MIVDKVTANSPQGGFIKKDPINGRWYRIKENEARDKVGHAIRKAVQRLEHTKPKLAAKMKKEFISTQLSLRSSDKDEPSVSSSSQTSGGVAVSKTLQQHKTLEPPTTTNAAKRNAIIADKMMQDYKAAPSSLERVLGSALSRQQNSIFQTRNLPPMPMAARGSAQIHGLPVRSALSHIDHASLVAASIMAQTQRSKAPLPAHLAGIFSLSSAIQPRVSAENILLESALQKQREARLTSELSLARRLALSALRDIAEQTTDTVNDNSIGKRDYRRSNETAK